ncbi:MAG: metallophosphoesterase [Candidatus Hydrogenedentales bacterium]|jgi:hypothetical protein
MAGTRITPAGEAAVQLLEEFPTSPSHTLAKLAVKRWPELFTSLDHARQTIRNHRGAKGSNNRKRFPASAGRRRAASDVEACRRWGFVPPAEVNPWRVHRLPPKVKRWLILADLHIPYHDPDAVKIALDYGKQTHCDGVILLGDIPDCYRLSRFAVDPRQRRFPEEVEAVRGFLRGLQKQFGTIVWKAGNHEMRLERYLMTRAPDLFGMEAFSWEAFMGLKTEGIVWVPPMDPIVQGKLTLLHGHEWPAGTSTPVNPARTAFLKATACVLVAHQHRSSEHTEQTLDGTTVTCWSVGCLCDLHPSYRPIANKWNSGLACLDLTAGTWRVENRRIIQGEVV